MIKFVGAGSVTQTLPTYLVRVTRSRIAIMPSSTGKTTLAERIATDLNNMYYKNAAITTKILLLIYPWMVITSQGRISQ